MVELMMVAGILTLAGGLEHLAQGLEESILTPILGKDLAVMTQLIAGAGTILYAATQMGLI